MGVSMSVGMVRVTIEKFAADYGCVVAPGTADHSDLSLARNLTDRQETISTSRSICKNVKVLQVLLVKNCRGRQIEKGFLYNPEQ